MKDFLFELIIVVLILTNGIIIGMHSNKLSDNENALLEQQSSEYQKCIAKLPRDKDCTLTGFVYTITPKKG